MHVTVESVLWALALISIVGFPGFVVLFYLGARNAVRTREAASAPPRSDIALLSDDALPAVTVLKPCAGADDDLEGCLRSYLEVSYPREKLQFVFGVRDRRDAAWPVLEKLAAEYAQHDIELVLSGDPSHPSPKISNVDVMAARAKHGTYWLSDSNTRVHSETLRDMASRLAQPGVGLVASPVSGDDEQTVGAALDVLELNTLAGLATYAIFGATGMCAAPGKSMLFERAHLDRIGGWREVGQYFGEDFILMEAIRSLGLRLSLGRYMITNVSVGASFQRAMARHLRWSQIRWRVMFFSTPFELLLSPSVPAAALLALSPSLQTLGFFALALCVNLAGDLAVSRRFRGHALAPRFLWLAAARPFVNLYLTVRGAFPGRVVWRGNFLYMGPRSRCLTEPAMRMRLRSLRESLRPQA